MESAKLTRCTPLIRRMRDISLATSSWVFVQPFISKAGAAIAARRTLVEPPTAPPGPDTLAPGAAVPVKLCSEAPAGTTRERSTSAPCQSSGPR